MYIFCNRFFSCFSFAVLLLSCGLIFATTVQAQSISSCSADINLDGKVDLNDYSLLVGNFFKIGTGLVGDINLDGKVNILDYSLLVTQFFDNCTLTQPTTSPSASPEVSPSTVPSDTVGIWATPAEIAALPTSGAAWNKVVADSKLSTTNPDFNDQDSKVDNYVLAKALVYAKTTDANCTTKNCREEVRDTIVALMANNSVEWSSINNRWEARSWDWLGVIRGLGAFAAAADLINLQSFDPAVDAEFRAWLPKARDAWVFEGGSSARGSVVSAQEKRPNNFGGHAGASRVAVDLYLGDTTDLAQAVNVFKGMLGDRSAYSDFVYGDLWYQCDPVNPVPINPASCQIQGHPAGSILTEEQRRCASSFSWPLCKSDYLWEGLQGIIVIAELLHRQGYPAYQWSDQAVLRAANNLNTTIYNDGTTQPAVGDDQFLAYIIDERYGTNFVSSWGISPGVTAGKMMGYTDWILGN